MKSDKINSYKRRKRTFVISISYIVTIVVAISGNLATACTPVCFDCSYQYYVCDRNDCQTGVQWIPDPNFQRQPYNRLIPGAVYYTKTDPAPTKICLGDTMQCPTHQLTTTINYQSKILGSVPQLLPLFNYQACGVSSSSDPRDRIPTVMSCAYQHEDCNVYCGLGHMVTVNRQCCWSC